MQGVSILTGCLCLAGNQYLKRADAKNQGLSDEKRAANEARAKNLGDVAIGMLSACTLLTIATGVANVSPSLLFIAAPTFLLAGYCRSLMTKTKVPAAATPCVS